jgi:uncharacterized protein (DUF488 family)
MLNRQKLILKMIERAGRPVGHLELTKWSFLLAHETPSLGGASFYQFLPYHLGPFSFCLYREIAALVHDGYLADEGKAWRIVEDVKLPAGGLPPSVQEDAVGVVERFQDTPSNALLDYVYQRFPWFTVNSAKRRLQARPVAASAVYTVGYEGWLVDGFLDMLMRAGIQRVLDVRNNPVARRYGFHKGTLSRLCENVCIEYQHCPQLGVPREWRQGLGTSADYEALFARYEAVVLGREAAAVDRVAAMVIEKPTALMCMEADPARCHRSRLAEAVSRKTCLPVRHLEGTR